MAELLLFWDIPEVHAVDKGVSVCGPVAIILQVEGSWQYIRGCIHTAAHARNKWRALSTLLAFVALSFVASF